MAVTREMTKPETVSWQGYARNNGTLGIRNRLLVIYTVKCSEFVAASIVNQAGHPDVELMGFDGCTDNQYAVNLLISMIRHPNVGAVLAVGLNPNYLKLLSALVVAVFLTIPYWKGRYFSKPVRPAKKEGSARA